MQVVVISGLSGSGKSIALAVLEDAGYYCIDNLPVKLLAEACELIAQSGSTRMAVAIDARRVASSGHADGADVHRRRGSNRWVGMVAGTSLRKRANPVLFRKLFFLALWLLGAYLAVRTLSKM